MSELFDKNTDTIGLHIRNIYKENDNNYIAWLYPESVLKVKYHPYKGWFDEPPKRGAVLIFIFTAETLSTQRTCSIFLLSAERAESKNQQPFRPATRCFEQDTLISGLIVLQS
jgi:hypothetical protein